MFTGTVGGTLRIMDTLEYGQESIIEYGIDLAFDQFAEALMIHNQIRNEFSMDVVEGTTKESRHRFGGQSKFQMKKVDVEFSMGRKAAKVGAGQTMGLPIDTYAPESLQWTERYFKSATVEEVNAQMNAQLVSDVVEDRRQLAIAIFTPTNRTFVDEMTDGTSLAVKALANGDGWILPIIPQTGESVSSGGSHTHYTAVETLTNANVETFQNNVREHFENGTLKIYINVAQESAISALTDFVKAADPRIVLNVSADSLSGQKLDLWSTYNRRIGIIEGGAEVWVKPWIPAGYLFCFVEGATKPLMRRQDKYDSTDLQIVQMELPDNRRGKLKAWSVERTFGYGVVNRINGACLQVTGSGGGTTYVVPTL
jgi:hypothetical protein